MHTAAYLCGEAAGLDCLLLDADELTRLVVVKLLFFFVKGDRLLDGAVDLLLRRTLPLALSGGELGLVRVSLT